MRYFNLEEFNCPCCNVQHMDALFLAQIDNAREYAGVPFFVTSGYRCDRHNKEAKSSSNNHPSGKAADISCTNSVDRMKIVKALIRAGFRRIGIDKTYIHVDSMDKIECLWLY